MTKNFGKRRNRIHCAPLASLPLAAAGLACSWCGRPLAALTPTVVTTTGRRHAMVFTSHDDVTGRRRAFCLEIPAAVLASDMGFRRLLLAARRERNIRVGLEGAS